MIIVSSIIYDRSTGFCPVNILGLRPTLAKPSRLFRYEYSPAVPYLIQAYAVLFRKFRADHSKSGRDQTSLRFSNWPLGKSGPTKSSRPVSGSLRKGRAANAAVMNASVGRIVLIMVLDGKGSSPLSCKELCACSLYLYCSIRNSVHSDIVTFHSPDQSLSLAWLR